MARQRRGKSPVWAVTLVSGGRSLTLPRIAAGGLPAHGALAPSLPALTFLTKEAVRLAIGGTITGVACEGCPPLGDLAKRYEATVGRYSGHTIPLWEWIGDEAATTFSY